MDETDPDFAVLSKYQGIQNFIADDRDLLHLFRDWERMTSLATLLDIHSRRPEVSHIA